LAQLPNPLKQFTAHAPLLQVGSEFVLEQGSQLAEAQPVAGSRLGLQAAAQRFSPTLQPVVPPVPALPEAAPLPLIPIAPALPVAPPLPIAPPLPSTPPLPSAPLLPRAPELPKAPPKPPSWAPVPPCAGPSGDENLS
jgi:hypothetical protein